MSTEHPLEQILDAIESQVGAAVTYPVSRDRDIAFQGFDEGFDEPATDLPAIDIRLGDGADEEEASLGQRRVVSTIFVDLYAEPQPSAVSSTLLRMYRDTYNAIMAGPKKLGLPALVHRVRPAGHDAILTNAEGARTVAMLRTSYAVTWQTALNSATEV